MIGIYPVETLKTQMMSSTESPKRSLATAAKRVWALGGLKAYYRGLGVRQWLCPARKLLNRFRLAWLAYSRTCRCRSGVSTTTPHVLLPHRYSAIDMSTFEALKLAYLRSTGKDEPGVLAVLAFGSISGSVG